MSFFKYFISKFIGNAKGVEILTQKEFFVFINLSKSSRVKSFSFFLQTVKYIPL